MTIPAPGAALAQLVEVLAAAPGGAVIERAGRVVAVTAGLAAHPGSPPEGWLGQPVAAVGAVTGGAGIELDGVLHRVWYPTGAQADDPGFRALFDVNAAVMFIIDPTDGRIVDANRPAEQFYGWSRAELQAKTIHDINTLPRAEIDAEMARAHARARNSFRFKHRTRAGAVADVEVYSGPLEVGGRRMLLSIVHDVTARRQVEEQLWHARRLDALGRLAAGVAHDFNTLLTIIQAAVQLAERRGVAGAAADVLADIHAAARRGAVLTRQLLALGRQQALEPTVSDLACVVRAVTALIGRTLPASIDVQCEVADGLPPTLVDVNQLELVLLNLAINARDAMPDGGELRLVLRRAGAPPEPLVGEFLALEVSDTGVGMGDDTRDRIFEPFFTTKPEGLGTGLGLSMAFGLLNQSGGTITVASQPGRGTTFTLYLPVATGGAGG
ncbi:MAG: ATP-binding protein [Kofleriaceae bacterium]